MKTEKKYRKKFQKVMDIFTERVDNNSSSSGSCSSDEKYQQYKINNSKKRKYQEFLETLKNNQTYLG